MANDKRLPMSRRLVLRIDDDLGDLIARAAELERRPVPNLIRNVLHDALVSRRVAEPRA